MKVHTRRHKCQPDADCWFCQRDVARCQSKRTYDQWDAINAAHYLNAREDWANPVRAYWCRLCDHYHLTRAKTPRMRRRIETQGRRRLAREAAEG